MLQISPTELAASPPIPVVACLKWGTRYPGEYANRLFRAVRAHLGRPHRFVCFTDEPSGLDPAIEVRPIPPVPVPRAEWSHGMWPKLMLTGEGVLEPGTPVLFLDLDLMVTGDLGPFLDSVAREGGLWIIREWNPALLKLLPVALRPDRGGNSSVVAWIAGEQDHIARDFAADPAAGRAAFGNDQAYLTARARGRRYWPYAWCASFKRHCVWYWPLNLVMRHPQPPRWARVVVFHGKPDPTDLIDADSRRRWGGRRKFGFGPVPWVREYWNTYAD